MKFNTLRTHLFLAFSILSAIFIATLLGSVYFYNKRNNIAKSIRKTDDQRVLALKNFKLVDDFLTFETRNENYFKTGKSRIKEDLTENHKVLIENLEQAATGFSSENKDVKGLLDSALFYQKRYYKNFLLTEALIKEKGFKDFGVEGKMRKFAHELMEIKNLSVENEVLMLRRHEKDFIIRKEEEYRIKFNTLCDTLGNREKKYFSHENEWNEFKTRLKNYQKYFNEYCIYQQKIGSNEKEGYISRLDLDYKNMDRLFDVVKEKTIGIETGLHKVLKLFTIFLISITLIIALAFSYFYSRRISRSANTIKENMNKYVLSGFTDRPTDIKKFNIAEFDMISAHFLRMAIEIDGYVNFFKIKVEERTNEIRKQKEEIELQKHKIQIQRDLLINQKFALVEKNKNFTDSISYAERIQKAMLPPIEEFKRVFTDCFILYQPKDIVSGDFYWIEEVETIENKKEESVFEYADLFSGGAIPAYLNLVAEEKISVPKQAGKKSKTVLLAVADCTGHGVPGAFMSIMGINHLNKICKEYKVVKPAEVLFGLNNEIEASLKQTERGGWVKDGMDIAFCAFDMEKMTMSFAGANKKLWLIREEKFFEFTGDGFPIGSPGNVYFNSTEIKLQRGDCIYLCSDGYQDQFGGAEKKKFKSKNLKELLVKISTLPFSDQFSVLKIKFDEWKGNSFQVDDVTVIGIKI
ncbi:MAG: SpoIIE family protein phosphatase [Bacteroidia bacterium]|nr:SpoIIE family protein phosphatase [Bacteroidia bacterium]